MNVLCLERIRCVLKYLSVFNSTNLILAILIPATLIGPSPAWAQPPPQSSAPSSTTSGTLHGQVTDPSGAVVPNAAVAVLVSGGQPHSATTNRSGNYEIGNLAPGKYTVTANAPGFAVFVQNDVDVAAGQVAQFNIALDINVEKEKVNVQEEGPQLDVNPSNNASAIVLNGKDLEALIWMVSARVWRPCPSALGSSAIWRPAKTNFSTSPRRKKRGNSAPATAARKMFFTFTT